MDLRAEVKQTFARIKPVCDIVMLYPTQESIAQFMGRVAELKKEVVHELQQYLLFPFITHIKSTEIEKQYELQCRIIDAMRTVLEKSTVTSFEMCIKIETGLLSLVFDNSKNGMIADVPEELKHSIMKCLTVLMLNLDIEVRKKMLRTQVPLIAQAIFVSVHIAKLEKLRALRLAAIDCVTAHTVSHRKLTGASGHIGEVPLEALVTDMLASILPGVLAALQDVAVCPHNPGHAIIVASVNAIHRILCLTMNDKYLVRQRVTAADFAKMVAEKGQPKEVSNKGKKPKDLAKRSAEWYAMAGEKLVLITKSLVSLATHEHVRVRKELAVYCARILTECHQTMQPSVPIALDVLISFTKDEHSEVSEYCSNAVSAYFGNATGETREQAMDSLCGIFFDTLTTLPRVLNNIDSARKISALNLMHGYLEVLCAESNPSRLATALTSEHNLQCLVTALLEAASVHTELVLLMRHSVRDVTTPPPASSPWCRLRHLDDPAAKRLWSAVSLLGVGGALILDRLPPTSPEAVALANVIATGPNAPPDLAKRVLDSYLEESVWYLPLEVSSGEIPLTEEDTLDVSVYDPRAWTKDSVPGLYEGAVETRVTGISYQTPRVYRRDPDTCATLGEAQRNMALCCLLTEGVGLMARKLMDDFQPYLLKTLCLILERVGSTYEMLHLAGVKAITDIATACGHGTVRDLIRCNADYFTNQISVRLKKAWNTQSALQILSVVMEYSDASILDCLYGIVEDVLVQSLDKYHEKNLVAYLQVFLTFITCIRKWFPEVLPPTETRSSSDKEIGILKDLMEYVKLTGEAEKLLNDEEDEKGQSAEEMFKEDQIKREEGVLDYDDRVTEEKAPLPRHITVTQTILKRCLNFVPSKNSEEAILALQIINHGLPVLRAHEDELLPLVHLVWAPLVARFENAEAIVLQRAFDLLITMAALAKDFIKHRTVTEVLPHIYSFLHKSSRDSLLKDRGSAYRNSPPYRLQLTALGALTALVTDLRIDGDRLDDALACVDVYLSKKQPKPLQELAVKFFKAMLDYDYGATWFHLRQLADNEQTLPPPEGMTVPLSPVVGTPYQPSNPDYVDNIAMLFEGHQHLENQG